MEPRRGLTDPLIHSRVYFARFLAPLSRFSRRILAYYCERASCVLLKICLRSNSQDTKRLSTRSSPVRLADEAKQFCMQYAPTTSPALPCIIMCFESLDVYLTVDSVCPDSLCWFAFGSVRSGSVISIPRNLGVLI